MQNKKRLHRHLLLIYIIYFAALIVGFAAVSYTHLLRSIIAHCVTARPNSLPAASVSVKLRVESTRPYLSLIHI